MLYKIAWLILQPLRFLFCVRGVENIPRNKESGLLVIANHNSPLDPWKIGGFLPRLWLVRWFAKKQFFDCEESIGEFLSWPIVLSARIPLIMQRSGAIPVNTKKHGARENTKALRLALEILRGGGEIGIFPRGTMEATEYLNSAFVSLALKTNSPILPVFVQGREVIFGGPFSLVPQLCGKSDHEKIAREIIENIEARFVESSREK